MFTSPEPWATREAKDREGTPRQREILDAARQVFERKGFEAATVADIADAAGVSRPTFYVYYASKSEAFHAVAEQVMDRFWQAQRIRNVETMSVSDVIRATIVSTFDQTVEHIGIMTVLDHQALIDSDIQAVWLPLRQRVVDRTASYISGQVQRGTIDPRPDSEALGLMGSGMLDLFASLVVEGRETREAAVERMYQVWAAALGLPD